MVLETETAWTQIRKSIGEADKVLVGIGTEFEQAEGGESVRLRNAYKNLKDLLAEKDSYIVSLCMNDMIYQQFGKDGKMVCPCGSRLRLQCEAACTGELYPTEKMCPAALPYLEQARWKEAEEQLPVCPHCNSRLVFNTIQTENYLEEGYLEQWNQYKGWLQSTINRKLCILELGVGMQFPGVIRWAFDKLAFYNQKAEFYRVHASLYQHTSENGERGYSVKESGLTFLNLYKTETK